MSTRVADYLNALSAEAARALLEQCCGARRWVEEMSRSRPFTSDAHLFEVAERAWWRLEPAHWLEAFARHPRIGERATTDWSRREQSGMNSATSQTRRALVQGNQAYERRFGHVFLICATGRSADDMLAELRRRMGNEPAAELKVAAGEQAEITRLRLEKLVTTP